MSKFFVKIGCIVSEKQLIHFFNKKISPRINISYVTNNFNNNKEKQAISGKFEKINF